MDPFLALTWASVALLVFGIGCFLRFLQTRNRWIWGVAVVSMSLAITWMWIWWG
ncbi:MAG: hypothetical protein K2R98_32845 [Gemmataceae bacterium]|nr:hypothetical protein [Gemmataceae bacterium]